MSQLTLPVPDPARTARLRDALQAADFTADGCLELLGATAYAALSRGETVPGAACHPRRRTAGDAGAALPAPATPFPRAGSVPCCRWTTRWRTAGCTRDGDGTVRATVDVRPYAGDEGEDWWIVSDLGCAVGGAGGIGSASAGPGAPAVDRSQLVLGVGGASTTLAGITVRTPVAHRPRPRHRLRGAGAARRRGTPAGSPRPTSIRAPCDFARLTLALSGVPEADLRQGSLFEPVGGGTFDLIVSNPPFVISPGARFTYRDGGMAGDDLCRTLVQRSADHLTEGGYCQLLANWQHVEGEDWRERVTSWVPPGCDAWIVQREVQDVAQYAELWLRDGGDHRADPAAYAARYDAWLDEFEAHKVRGVGFGWITLRRSGADTPSVTAEEWPHPVEQPLGPADRATGSTGRTSCAGTTTPPCWASASGSPTRSSRSRSDCPARRIPSTWCCAATAECAGPRRWTPSARGSQECVTDRSPPAESWTPSPSCSARIRSYCATVPRRRSGCWWSRVPAAGGLIRRAAPTA